jgi:hypothetical protein
MKGLLLFKIVFQWKNIVLWDKSHFEWNPTPVGSYKLKYLSYSHQVHCFQ